MFKCFLKNTTFPYCHLSKAVTLLALVKGVELLSMTAWILNLSSLYSYRVLCNLQLSRLLPTALPWLANSLYFSSPNFHWTPGVLSPGLSHFPSPATSELPTLATFNLLMWKLIDCWALNLAPWANRAEDGLPLLSLLPPKVSSNRSHSRLALARGPLSRVLARVHCQTFCDKCL